jgi:hypothetical protein
MNGDPHLGHARELVQVDGAPTPPAAARDAACFRTGTDDNALKNAPPPSRQESRSPRSSPEERASTARV